MDTQTRYLFSGTHVTQSPTGCNITTYLTDTTYVSYFRTTNVPELTLEVAMAILKRFVKVSPPPSNQTGDCFVILSPEGRYFNGRDWEEKWQQARQYAMPVEPSERCEVEANLLRGFGLPCEVAYIPRSKIAIP